MGTLHRIPSPTTVATFRALVHEAHCRAQSAHLSGDSEQERRMTARLRIIPIRAGSSHYYAAADALRTLANSALVRGDIRGAAQMTIERKALKAEGDALIERELEDSLVMVGEERTES